jgi:peptidoglycan/xylan/chitin deacetylase (PgdA/CDA1 family)
MDIASHTKSHINLTNNLSDRQLRTEIIDSRKQLENMGFTVRTFLYPFYEWDDRAIDSVIEAGYTCARGGWSSERAYDLNVGDPRARYHVPAWQISNQDIESFKSIVATASRNTVVSLTYHLISSTGPDVTSTTEADFISQMSYLKKTGFTVVLLPDLFSSTQPASP